VPEDVLIYPRIIGLARQAGFKAGIALLPSIQNRGEKETIYYLFLKMIPGLERLVPCTGDFVFEKP